MKDQSKGLSGQRFFYFFPDPEVEKNKTNHSLTLRLCICQDRRCLPDSEGRNEVRKEGESLCRLRTREKSNFEKQKGRKGVKQEGEKSACILSRSWRML